jgi:hypothetical protein
MHQFGTIVFRRSTADPQAVSAFDHPPHQSLHSRETGSSQRDTGPETNPLARTFPCPKPVASFLNESSSHDSTPSSRGPLMRGRQGWELRSCASESCKDEMHASYLPRDSGYIASSSHRSAQEVATGCVTAEACGRDSVQKDATKMKGACPNRGSHVRAGSWDEIIEEAEAEQFAASLRQAWSLEPRAGREAKKEHLALKACDRGADSAPVQQEAQELRHAAAAWNDSLSEILPPRVEELHVTPRGYRVTSDDGICSLSRSLRGNLLFSTHDRECSRQSGTISCRGLDELLAECEEESAKQGVEIVAGTSGKSVCANTAPVASWFESDTLEDDVQSIRDDDDTCLKDEQGLAVDCSQNPKHRNAKRKMSRMRRMTRESTAGMVPSLSSDCTIGHAKVSHVASHRHCAQEWLGKQTPAELKSHSQPYVTKSRQKKPVKDSF